MAQNDDIHISRRNLLKKLGLAAGAAYVAPTLAGLDVARASSGSSGGGDSNGGGGSGPSRNSAPSAATRPSPASRPSRTTRPSATSRPSRPRSSASRQTEWRWDWNSARFVRVNS